RGGRNAARRGDKTLRNKNRNHLAVAVQVSGEIAADLRGSGDGKGSLIGQIQAEPIGAKMEKGFVFSVVELRDPYRATEREAKIVLVDGWSGTLPCSAAARRVGPGRVENRIAHDLESVAMQLIGSRSKLIGGNTLGQSVLGGKVGGQDLDFADHLERRIDVGLEALGFRLDGNDAVKNNFIFKVHA